ncbi:CPBP family intramembrane glutamic endopeptidase [Mucilaginibacter celer]|uniref:CPBP family intramembrane metalloprotease n=1 Tax=Mucilaginibacter celer TaxID=2305508 RepID=A0A494VL32_9SPHI|nr:CPBP family intramembrane glutamic endopeptidase [Mucilaginibacter celer]AYL95936.1 CPBP family intramembrane metalloprotease [Mucilaginibacter celer]
MTAYRVKRATADAAMIILLVTFPHLGLLPMYAFSVLLLLIIWLYLKLWKEGLAEISFRITDFKFRCFWLGGLIGLAYAIFAWWIIRPLFDALGFPPADVSSFYYIRHNPFNFLVLLVIAGVLVIPFEEIVYRGFILTRVKAMFGNYPHAFMLSGIITSLIFALYHYQEGWGAVTAIFIGALFTIWLYKVFKGNLWYLIFFHFFYDVFMLGAIYLGYN